MEEDLQAMLAKVTEERDVALELVRATQQALEAAQAALRAEQKAHENSLDLHAPMKLGPVVSSAEIIQRNDVELIKLKIKTESGEADEEFRRLNPST